MTGITIRTIAITEWRQYRAVRLRALEDSPDAFSSTLEQGLSISNDEWAARLTSASPERDRPIVAVRNGEFVGLLWARIEPDDANTAQLYQMWVAPEVRGQGVGRWLLDEAISWLSASGVGNVVLGVTEGDRPARRLYERAGFVPFGEMEPLRPGSVLRIQNMLLRLV